MYRGGRQNISHCMEYGSSLNILGSDFYTLWFIAPEMDVIILLGVSLYMSYKIFGGILTHIGGS